MRIDDEGIEKLIAAAERYEGFLDERESHLSELLDRAAASGYFGLYAEAVGDWDEILAGQGKVIAGVIREVIR